MKGTFEVIDGKPFVLTNKKKHNKFKVTNIRQCMLLNTSPTEHQSIQIWNIVPFTDKNFWDIGKQIPVIVCGQKVKIEVIENKRARITNIKY